MQRSEPAMAFLNEDGTNPSRTSGSFGVFGHGCSNDFRERYAMILGMNAGPLRQRRMWTVYLWKQQRHWALVLQPTSEPFEARAVDDFMYSPTHCCNVEVPSSRFFLVYELLLPDGILQLMLSVKTNFDPSRDCVEDLGHVGLISFEEICAHAEQVVDGYRCYSLVGSNCQHFSKDFAARLNTPVSCVPEDEAVATSALNGAHKAVLGSTAVGATCVGAVVAPETTALTAAAYVGSHVAFGSSLPLVVVALGAGTIGLGAGIILGSVGAGYGLLHAGLRTGSTSDEVTSSTVLQKDEILIHQYTMTLIHRALEKAPR